MKKSYKAKEPIKIRFKKLANGNRSIYLDIYTNGKRDYEFLKLYIIPEKTPNDKIQNAETLKLANAVKSQRIIEIQNNQYGMSNNKQKAKILFVDWFESAMKTKKTGTIAVYQSALNYIKAFDATITLGNVDANYLDGLIQYISKNVGNNTCLGYITKIKMVVVKAVKEGIINQNPFDTINKDLLPKATRAQRGFLSIEEIKQLRKTEYSVINVKRAFLFSCFTGLRYSDIKDLRYSDIKNIDGKKFISIQMQKTKENVNIPLSDMALEFVDFDNANNDDLLFKLPHLVSINEDLKVWAKLAKIEKNLSFHIARHTFATLHLTLGADIYTISKLLGHTNIKTTQIYAEIINQKKIDAVNLTNGVF